MNIPKFIYNILALTLLTIVLFLPLYFFQINQKKEKEELYFKTKLTQEKLKFEAVENSYTLISRNIFDNIINKKEILELIQKANLLDDDNKTDALRKKLYVMLLPLYTNLKTQDIRQLHFQLQGNSSFLRFHSPQYYGDSLVGVRYSIDKVNLRKEAVHGFEEGRIFNGFRNVFPLINRNKLVGSVEISYSFNAIKNQLKRIYPGYYSFIIKKEIIQAKVFKENQNNYIPTPISSFYMQDKETIDTASKAYSKALIQEINANIQKDASQKVKTGLDFLLETTINKHHYVISFIAVSNVEKKQVAYYIVYQEDKALDYIQNSFILYLVLALFISLFVSVLLVLYYRSQQKSKEALKVLATTDPLTKIANRHKLNMVMDILIHRSQRYDLPLSVIFFDIDAFKAINDKLGHETGDEILVELSNLVTTTIRSADLLARWGGEEFIILLPETNHAQARELAEKLRKIISEHHFVITAKLTCSFGVTQLRKDDDEISLLKRVDTALYSAKDSGRNRVIELG